MEEKLRDLVPGESAKIIGYEPSSKSYREKLLAMGLTKGAVLTMKKIAPLGDPLEITLRGFDLSLRKDEADILIMRRVK
jgi:ferrous iron transport protein A